MIKKCFLFIVLISRLAIAEPIYAFENPQQYEIFQHLTESVRCLVCQNQNIADSNSLFSITLKDKMAAMVRSGDSQLQIESKLIAHYGEKVLFNPAKDSRTWLLWYGPFALLLIVPVVLLRVRRT